jgi:hypothetical protein
MASVPGDHRSTHQYEIKSDAVINECSDFVVVSATPFTNAHPFKADYAHCLYVTSMFFILTKADDRRACRRHGRKSEVTISGKYFSSQP